MTWTVQKLKTYSSQNRLQLCKCKCVKICNIHCKMYNIALAQSLKSCLWTLLVMFVSCLKFNIWKSKDQAMISVSICTAKFLYFCSKSFWEGMLLNETFCQKSRKSSKLKKFLHIWSSTRGYIHSECGGINSWLWPGMRGANTRAPWSRSHGLARSGMLCVAEIVAKILSTPPTPTCST